MRIHDLRHTYASMAVASGLNLEMIAKLLGHSQLQTTARYVHLADGQVREAGAMVATNLAGYLERGRQNAARPSMAQNVVAFPIR